MNITQLEQFEDEPESLSRGSGHKSRQGMGKGRKRPITVAQLNAAFSSEKAERVKESDLNRPIFSDD